MIDETVEEIEDMRTHSSSEVALTAIRALRSITDTDYATVEEYTRSLTRNCRALRQADPSHASLFTATKAVESALDQADVDTVAEAQEATRHAIDEAIDHVETMTARAAERAADRIEPGGTYLTIDYSSTVVGTLEAAALPADEPADVYAMEARPRFLGRKMARRMRRIEGVRPHLLVDSAMGVIIDRCDAVLTGMTCVVDDVLYNRVGTYPLAVVADRHDVPMYTVGADTKVVDDQFVFDADDRGPNEVSLEPLEGVVIENPSYDATPVSLLTAVVTDVGDRFTDQ